MKKFRATFFDGPTGNLSKKVDLLAEDTDHALKQALKMREASDRRFTDVSVEEVKDGPKNIGLVISYYDTVIRRNFRGYVFIRANSEKEAVAYYNSHLRGGRFWFHAGETEADGKCVRREVVDTYYAAGPGYDFDACADTDGR